MVANFAKNSHGHWRRSRLRRTSRQRPWNEPPSTIRKAFLATLILTALPSCVKDHTGTCLQEGEQLPEFTAILTGGQTVTSDDLTKKPSLVILFTTTCPDCHRQLPEVQSAWELLSEDANFLAVARGEGCETVEAFWKASGLTIPVSAPGDRTVYDLFDRGSGTGVPQVYISATGGKVLLTGNDKSQLSATQIIKALRGTDS